MNLDREKKLAEASVYRALGTLTSVGLVHRIGRQRRYAAVEARLADTDRVGLLCEYCECIRFLPVDPAASGFARAIRERGFTPHRFRIELGGACRACSLRQSTSQERPEVSS